MDPSDEMEIELVKKRAVRGVAALTGRHFILYGVSFLAQGLLGAFLNPEEWGVFALVSAVVNFLVYFSDVGLAASLIQKREKVTEEDLKTTFTVQQFLVITLLAILFLTSPLIKSTYELSSVALQLLYALGFSFFLSSLKTIPSVLLERKIKFEKLALASIAENLAYNIVLVYFAWQGYGISSFSYAVLFRGVIGLVFLYTLEPWMPGFAFSRKSLRNLLTFGIPYQVNTLVAVVKDDGIIIVLGRLLGLESMGILIWAQKWAQMPLRLFMDHVTKVTFPAFSRMQNEKEHLSRSVTRSIFFICFLVFPAIAGLLVTAPILIQIVPRYEKWAPALLPLSLISINVVFAAVTTQLTNLLNATGRIRTTFKLMLMWASLTWLIVPYAAMKYGVAGAAGGYALVGASSVIAIIVVKKVVNFSLWEGAGKPGLSALVMGMVLLFARNTLDPSLLSFVILVVIGIIAYGFVIFALARGALINDVKKFTSSLFSK